jgi:hypothetical protein
VWSDDFGIDEIRKHLAPVTLAEDECLCRHTYSSILYRMYRNVWIHRGGGPGSSQPIWTGLREDEPYYDNYAVGSGTRRVLVLPIGLLIKTYEQAIDSLERACVAEQKDPAVGLDPE